LEQADTTFQSGNYQAAITQYEAILTHSGYSAPVLFNLGNACYRNSQFGAAILNYERALILAPRDMEIAANLRLAREKAGVPAPAPGEIVKAARFVSPNTLAWIGSGALIVICLAIGLGRFFPRFTQVKAVISVAGMTLLVVAASFAIRWPEFNRAIVVVANAPARIAPASTAAESFALRAGEPVAIAKSYGPFVLARTPDGRAGWVNEKEIGRVFAPRLAEYKQS
jgi:tetratricopeptide (TPR) repeat protein